MSTIWEDIWMKGVCKAAEDDGEFYFEDNSGISIDEINDMMLGMVD